MTVRFCILLITTSFFAVGTSAQDPATPATLLSAPQPAYPRNARNAGIGGKIVVRVVLDETGAVVSVDNPTGPDRLCQAGESDPRVTALRESVIESIKQAKFSPALKEGKPAKAIIYLASTFDPTEDSPGPLPPGEKKIVRDPSIVAKAVSMPKPLYPSEGRAARAAGPVSVRVVIDETGTVFTAEAVSGHPLLRTPAMNAACQAKFEPTLVDQTPVRVTGIITYNFTSN